MAPIATDSAGPELAIPETLGDGSPSVEADIAEAVPQRRRLFSFAEFERAPSLGPNRSMFGAD
jgi:hypothetical protein